MAKEKKNNFETFLIKYDFHVYNENFSKLNSFLCNHIKVKFHITNKEIMKKLSQKMHSTEFTLYHLIDFCNYFHCPYHICWIPRRDLTFKSFFWSLKWIIRLKKRYLKDKIKGNILRVSFKKPKKKIYHLEIYNAYFSRMLGICFFPFSSFKSYFKFKKEEKLRKTLRVKKYEGFWIVLGKETKDDTQTFMFEKDTKERGTQDGKKE